MEEEFQCSKMVAGVVYRCLAKGEVGVWYSELREGVKFAVGICVPC